MVGANSYENNMEGVLEQRSEMSSYRRRILPLTRIRYKVILIIRIDKEQIDYLSEIRWNRAKCRPKHMFLCLGLFYFPTADRPRQ